MADFKHRAWVKVLCLAQNAFAKLEHPQVKALELNFEDTATEEVNCIVDTYY